eukprot:scaffold93246_cov20-Tisochrysis_lutea.AAC.6
MLYAHVGVGCLLYSTLLNNHHWTLLDTATYASLYSCKTFASPCRKQGLRVKETVKDRIKGAEHSTIGACSAPPSPPAFGRLLFAHPGNRYRRAKRD